MWHDEARSETVHAVSSATSTGTAPTIGILLVPEFCPAGPRLICGPTVSTNQMHLWD